MEGQNQSLIRAKSGLLAALSMTLGATSNILPKDILVLETIVAGTSFRKLQEIEPQLIENTKLKIVREGKNEYDRFAVALHFDDQKVGYIPKDNNEVIARLLDAGKPFYATIANKEWEGNWLRLEVKIFLKD